MNYYDQAKAKLEAEGKFDRYASAMKGAVKAKLLDFCRQDEEFAQAVVQGGNFADCMKKVAAGVGQSISDIDAYKKAVEFYFPGAKVRMQLSIDLIGDADPSADAPVQAEAPKILSLEDFFG